MLTIFAQVSRLSTEVINATLKNTVNIRFLWTGHWRMK